MKNKISTWDYLWYALYAFGGLGLEIVLMSLIEPMMFGGISTSNYTPAQTIIHWLLTMLCWGITAALLIRTSKKSLDFDVLSDSKPTRNGQVISAVLVIICIVLNAFDWGTLKIIGEFQKKGLLLFIFQYLYYFFEVVLVYLIVAFGQKFAESLLQKKTQIPWGGVVLCCTWGAVHILSKGSIYTGIGVMTFALLYGVIYLLLKRNSKWSYLAMVIAFTI